MTCCPGLQKFLAALLITACVAGVVMMSGKQPLAADKSDKALRHVVMFKFKESSSAADIQQVVDAFKALPSQIPEIAAFEYGTDNSPEGLARGFTHCFLLSFKSEEDRAVYLPHPAHKAFGAMLGPHLAKEGVLVVDYWAE